MISYQVFLTQCPFKPVGSHLHLRCQARKKWVKSTPEEQVRQYALYLLLHLDYPSSHLAIERAFTYLARKKRMDVLAYDTGIQPFLLVECKRSDLPLRQADFTQLLSYNAYWKVPYIALFNGYTCMCFYKTQQNVLRQMHAFPSYPTPVA